MNNHTVADPKIHPDPEVVAHGKRRRFTDGYKQRILAEVDQAKGSGGIGILLRREGLYSSLLASSSRAPQCQRMTREDGEAHCNAEPCTSNAPM